jgi:hypothetical protein
MNKAIITILLLVCCVCYGDRRRAQYQKATTASSSFQPSDISGLVVDTDPDEIAGADGSAIATAPDQSGNGNDFGQATAGNRPTIRRGVLNGHDAIRFDGSDDWMTNGAALGLTAATVVMVFSPSNTSYNFLDASSGASAYWRFADGDGYIATYRSARIDNYPTGMPTDSHNYIVIVSSASTYNIWLNGGDEGAQSASFLDGQLFLGALNAVPVNPTEGDMHRLLIYNKAINATERGQLHTWIQGRWGL